MKRTADVLIVGGGVIGCAIAYALASQGAEVILVEQGQMGAQTSSAAAGLLAPIRPLSHEDPFKVFQLAGMKRFASFIPELEEVSGIPVSYEQTGTLRILTPEMVDPARVWAEEWRRAGFRIDVLTSEEMYAYEPLLAPGLCSAVHIADEAQVTPVQFAKAYAQAARNVGALQYEHTEIVAFKRSLAGNSIEGVWTKAGNLLACNHLVIAAGVWSAKFGSWLGIPLPIRPVRGELVALRQPARSPLRFMVFDEGLYDKDIYISPKPDGTVIVGATKAEVGMDTSVSAGGVQHLLDVAIKLLPDLAHCALVRTWAGLRPKTPDSRPLLGPLPGWQNITVASGHGGFGITLSIITGEAIAELVSTGHCPAIISPFVPSMHDVSPQTVMTDEERKLVPYASSAFSDQQVKDCAIQWYITQFAVAPDERTRVRVIDFSYNAAKGYWHCLVDDVLLTIVVQDQALVVKTFVDYPVP